MLFTKNFPFFKQLEKMDCGPTCLRMISKYYGKDFTLQRLRKECFVTSQGVSMLGISTAAESLGFSTVAAQMTINQIMNNAHLPCIIHWRQNHFVVLYKLNKDRFLVADPAIGLISYSKNEFINGWCSLLSTEELPTGIVLMLNPEKRLYDQPDEKHSIKHDILHMLRYWRGYKTSLFYLAGCLLVGSAIQMVFPFLTQSIVDSGITKRDIKIVYLILLGQLVLFLGRTTADFTKRWILLHLSTRLNIQIISEFLVKLLNLPISFFDRKQLGDLLQRVDDHTRIERFLSTSSLSILFSLINVVIFGAILCFYSVKIFLVYITFSVGYIVYVSSFMKKRAELDYKRFNQLSISQSNLIQVIQGLPEIKLNNAEEQKQLEWKTIQEMQYVLSIKSMKLQLFQDGGSVVLNELKNILITIMSALAVIEGSITFGIMLSIQYIIGQLNGPVNEAISFMRDFQDARLSLERVGEIDTFSEETSVINKIKELPKDRGIRIQNLSFRYGGIDSDNVFTNLNLVIPERKITAIVGTSGSGKTTLVKLLLGFYNPTEGKIWLGSYDLRNIDRSEWLQQCGVVMQDGFIFSDSIAKNIALSSDTIDEARLTEALRVACIDDFVESLPLKHQTKIGANGTGLSQGQKQRVLIARAVYKNPSFIVFDEATSSLDARTETKILLNLQKYYEGRTVLIIAHRLSTVKNADQIIVLENGKVTEAGTHRQLTDIKGTYFELVRNQLELTVDN